MNRRSSDEAKDEDHGIIGGSLDLLRKSGEFPVSNEELDETATTVYKGI
jgi:hypothetical protein